MDLRTYIFRSTSCDLYFTSGFGKGAIINNLRDALHWEYGQKGPDRGQVFDQSTNGELYHIMNIRILYGQDEPR